jgi:hypothetical protein
MECKHCSDFFVSFIWEHRESVFIGQLHGKNWELGESEGR